MVFGGSEICKFSAARTFCIVNKSLNLRRRNLDNELGKSAPQVM